MACIERPIVFDDTHLLAVGALIRSHPDAGSQLGARITAARSAYLWGAHPIAVSSDGDVDAHFQSRNGDQQCDAVLNFLYGPSSYGWRQCRSANRHYVLIVGESTNSQA